MKARIISAFVLLLGCRHVYSQNATVSGIIQKGQTYLAEKKYDSALFLFAKGEKLVQKNALYTEAQSSVLLIQTGIAYEELRNVDNAHLYFMNALSNARKYNHASEKQAALLSLNDLHKLIRDSDIVFTYPAVSETDRAVAYFPVSKVEKDGDSLLVRIDAGANDGIQTTDALLDLFTHISAADTARHSDISFISSTRIISIGANHTIVKTKSTSVEILRGDLAAVYVQVPLSWRKLSIRNLLLNNLYLVDNYKQYPYHYRFYYYYADAGIEDESLQAFQSSVNEVVSMFGKDTATNDVLGKKIMSGIFTNFNAVTAMEHSTNAHLKLFLSFVNSFPAKYISNNYRFSETYATWVINNTPLSPGDIKPYLLAFASDEQLLKEAYQLSEQIEEAKLAATWFNEGMQNNIIDNIKEAKKNFRLLQSLSSSPVIHWDKGWNNILYAEITKRLGDNAEADAVLQEAEKEFVKTGNSEGMAWLKNTVKKWATAEKINVGIQNGHLLPYSVTASANPRYFATYSMDNTIKIWDRNLGKEIITLTDHTDEVSSLCFSNNGKYMLSTGLDTMVNVYNAYDYSLLHRYKCATPEKVIRFSNDNTFVASAGRDSLVKLRKIESGEILKVFKRHKGTVNDLCFHPKFDNYLYSAGSDSMVYKWDTETGEMLRWYRYQGKALSVKISPDGKYMSVVSTDSFITVRNTETHKVVYKFRVSVFSQGKNAYYAEEAFSPDSKYISVPTARDSFLVIQLNDNAQRIYSTGVKDFYLADLEYSSGGLSVFARFNLGGPLRIYNFAGWDIQTNTNINYKDIPAFANMIMAVQFTHDDNGLIVLHDEVSKIDLQSGKTSSLFYGASTVENKTLLLSDEKTGTYFEMNEPILNFYDYNRKNITRHFSLPASETVSAFELNEENNLCFLGSSRGLIRAWAIKEELPLYDWNLPTGDSGSVNKLYYDRHYKRLFAISSLNKIFVINALNGKTAETIVVSNPNYLTATRQYIYVTDEEGYLSKYDAITLRLKSKNRLNADGQFAYQLKLSPDEKMLYVQSGYTSVAAINCINDSILFTVQDHVNQITMFALSHDARMLAVTGFDNKINLYNALTGKMIVNIFLPKNRACMIADNDGHYMAPKNTLDAIIFSYKGNAYSFDQFDMQLNRPDIILSEIGRAEKTQLLSYEAAFKKRLSKLGFDEKNITNNVQLPVIRIQDKSEVKPVTNKSEFEFVVECSDNNYNLRSVHVLVNNSPVLGVNGMDLSHISSKELVQKIKVPLARGNNSIKVFCINERGQSSLKESFEIISNYKSKRESKTYFIGIGVANYKDADMSLQYSGKDIRDLAKMFDGLYSNLEIDTLLDANATRENILALKNKLALTDVNDRVIMAVTGHGLLNKSFDFYYATWDMDFANPEKRGIKYEDLEALLNNVPAQRKLLLIDACHSGALDKDELLNNKTGIVYRDSSERVSGTASRGVIKLSGNGREANNTFQVMQNMFADLSVSNGAVVISAAGGMEYALESGQWNNGVFTWCVMKGIAEKMADKDGGNFDGKVSVQELQQYVSKKVSDLTKGKQQPTSRRENVDFEWWLRF